MSTSPVASLVRRENPEPSVAVTESHKSQAELIREAVENVKSVVYILDNMALPALRTMPRKNRVFLEKCLLTIRDRLTETANESLELLLEDIAED